MNIKESLRALVTKVAAVKLPVFLIGTVVIFVYISWHIFQAVTVDPAVTSSATTARPHIDTATVTKIRQLQDNSVGVRALFDQARQNPFQE